MTYCVFIFNGDLRKNQLFKKDRFNNIDYDYFNECLFCKEFIGKNLNYMEILKHFKVKSNDYNCEFICKKRK